MEHGLEDRNQKHKKRVKHAFEHRKRSQKHKRSSKRESEIIRWVIIPDQLKR